MKILIVGGGTVGVSICSQLASEGHNITLVDTNTTMLTETANKYDVFGVAGNGADISVLRKAGADKADLLIAVTSSDEINILCCTAAKKLGTKHTVARVRNPEYNELMSLMKSDMNLSLTINPELAAAKEIYRMFRFPSATKIDTFFKGRVELAQYAIKADSPLCGITLNELRSKLNVKFLVCAVLRGDEAHIPSGLFTLQAGDLICFTAPEDEVTKLFKAIGAYKHPVKNILIFGASRTTYYLQSLLKGKKISSTIIEKDPDKCRELAEQFKCTVICNDGTKQELLAEEGLENKDAFLALSNIDEENAIVSMYAKTQNAKKVITMIHALSYVDLFSGVGLDSIVSPKSSTATFILRYIRSISNVHNDAEIESLHRLLDGKVEALEFKIKEDIDGLTGIPLKELKIKRGFLIACLLHDDKVIIPTGDSIITPSDTIIIVAVKGQIHSIKEILK